MNTRAMKRMAEAAEMAARGENGTVVYDGGNNGTAAPAAPPALVDCDELEGPEYGLAVTDTRRDKAYVLVRNWDDTIDANFDDRLENLHEEYVQ